MRAVFELPGPHAGEQVEVLLDRPVAIRAVAPGLGQRAAVGADLVGVQAVHVGAAATDELDGELVELLEVVGREEERVPLEAEPLDVFLDRVDVLDVFLRRIRVVEAQVARAAGLLAMPKFRQIDLAWPMCR